jgi:hypothetical protein
MKEAEDKMVLNITYDFSRDEKESAFRKLAVAAKKYDKSHPGCVALDGFQCLELEPSAFRDIVRRTFNLTFTPGELGSVVQHFDRSNNCTVMSQKYLLDVLMISSSNISLILFIHPPPIFFSLIMGLQYVCIALLIEL